MIELIQEKLNSHTAGNAVEEENAVKEILQEIALYSLWRSKFLTSLYVGAERAFVSCMVCRVSQRIWISCWDNPSQILTGYVI